MKRLIAAVALPLLFAPFACAAILGYDGLEPRGQTTDSGPDIATVDSGPRVDTADAAETIADGGDAGPVNVLPPTRPPGAAVASGKGKTIWLLMKHFYLGSQTHTSSKSKEAWREWGYDIDHVCTSDKESRDNVGTCLRVSGASTDVLVDGDFCRDNNWGSQIVPIVILSNPGVEDTLNAGLLKGSGTLLFRIDDVDDGADDPYAPASLYRASPTDGDWVPKFDGTDQRAIALDSVTGGDIAKPKIVFNLGFIKNGVWASGEPQRNDLQLPLGSFSTELILEGSVITFKLSADHTTATDGIISGGLPIAGFESLIRPIAENGGVCPGTTLYTTLLKTVQNFPDLVIGATNLQATGVTCDGISVGLGFDLMPIVPPTTLKDPGPPSPSKCGDGG